MGCKKYPRWSGKILRSVVILGFLCSLIEPSDGLLNSYLKADVKVQVVPLAQKLKGRSFNVGPGGLQKINSHHYLRHNSYGKNLVFASPSGKHQSNPAAEYKAHLKSLAQGLGLRLHVYGGQKPHRSGESDWKPYNPSKEKFFEDSPKLQKKVEGNIKPYKKKSKNRIKIVREIVSDDTTEDSQDNKQYEHDQTFHTEEDDDHRPKPKDGYREGYRKGYGDASDVQSFERDYESSFRKDKSPRFKDLEAITKSKKKDYDSSDCFGHERGLDCKPESSNNYNGLDSFEVYKKKYIERDRNLHKDRSEWKQKRSKVKGNNHHNDLDEYEGTLSYKGDRDVKYPYDEDHITGYRYSYGKEGPPPEISKDFRYFSESPSSGGGFSRYPYKSQDEHFSKEGLRYFPKEYSPESIGLPNYGPPREFGPDSKAQGYKPDFSESTGPFRPYPEQTDSYPPLRGKPVGYFNSDPTDSPGIPNQVQAAPRYPLESYPERKNIPRQESPVPTHYPRDYHDDEVLPHEINSRPAKPQDEFEGLKYQLDPYLPPGHPSAGGNPYTTGTPTISYNSRPIDHPEHEKGPYILQSPYPTPNRPREEHQPKGDPIRYPASSSSAFQNYPKDSKPLYPSHNLDDNPHVGPAGSSHKITSIGPGEKGFDVVYNHNYNLPSPPRPISEPPTVPTMSHAYTTPAPEIRVNSSDFSSLFPRKPRFTNPLESQWIGIPSSDALMGTRASVPLRPQQGTTEQSVIITASQDELEEEISSVPLPSTPTTTPTPLSTEGSPNNITNTPDILNSSSSNVVNLIHIGKNETSVSTAVSQDMRIGFVAGLVEDVELNPSTVKNDRNASTKPLVNLNMSSGKKFLSLV